MTRRRVDDGTARTLRALSLRVPFRVLVLGGFSLVGAACGPRSDAPLPANAASAPARSVFQPEVELRSTPTGRDANGVDAPRDPRAFGPRVTQLANAARARFVPLPAPPATAHPLVCDLLAWRGDLYVSHALDPLDRTGARIHRLRPAATVESEASPDWRAASWALVFDWNRGGRPDDPYARGGEGFTRLRVLGGTLMAPDADSPGPESFGVTGAWVENLVLRSRPDGRFPPLADRPAGALIQPWAYHAFDIIEYHGSWVVSGGVVNPDPSSGGRYPAGLWVSPIGADTLALGHTFAGRYGVARATYMHRFAGRLFIGMQNNQRKLPYDLAVISQDPAVAETRVELISLTPGRGYLTRSMVSSESSLYWLGEGYKRGPSALLRSDDGRRFATVELPDNVGAVQDMVIAPDGVRYLLTRRALLRAQGPDDNFERLADAPASRPFRRRDSFCGARLIAIGDALIAGSLKDGGLYQIVPER